MDLQWLLMAVNSRETTKGYMPTEESIPEKKKKITSEPDKASRSTFHY